MFAGEQVTGGFALPNEPVLVAIDQDFGSPATGVVVAGHAHAIRASRQDREQVTAANGELPVATDPVSAFTDRADDIPWRGGGVAALQWHDSVEGLVHRGPWEVVHRCVYHAEVFLFSGLEVQDFGHAHTGVSDE